jgi:uncharacterized membrane protein YhfC
VLELLYPLNALLMFFLPLGVGVVLAEKLGASWRVFGAGALAFVASQAVHLPLLLGAKALLARGLLPHPPEPWRLAATALGLGLAAALCEEPARYLTFRLLRRARAWRDALMLGAGHGGLEAMLLGALAGVGFAQLALLRDADLSALALPADRAALLRQQVAAYWSAPLSLALLGALERASALAIHLGLSVMVWRSLSRGSLWLAGAVGWHALVNAGAVASLPTLGVFRTPLGACRVRRGRGAAVTDDEGERRRIEESRFSR